MSNSKYQEAKSNIVNTLVRQIGYEAYKNLYSEDFDTLQELVDKATPKRPILNKIWEDEDAKNIYDEYGRINETLCVCPNCGESDIYDFEYNTRFMCCSNCGQRIDWSDENDR